MQIRKKVEIPAHVVEHTIGLVCDLCGAEAEGDEWGRGYRTEDTSVLVVVSHRSGYTLPEGGESTTFEIDICPECFRDRLIPWARSQGVTPREYKAEW